MGGVGEIVRGKWRELYLNDNKKSKNKLIIWGQKYIHTYILNSETLLVKQTPELTV